MDAQSAAPFVRRGMSRPPSLSGCDSRLVYLRFLEHALLNSSHTGSDWRNRVRMGSDPAACYARVHVTSLLSRLSKRAPTHTLEEVTPSHVAQFFLESPAPILAVELSALCRQHSVEPAAG